ncbi:MAG: LapA family protein [Neisseria sp.]|uniref:LapA family protein n=1 Tax=Neisseria sp. TaxID=192066 RepID=UPI0026DC0120|nr:LapA family protein [Neisseria sp.]MDO4641512.1 LapA family protein [Neisseria sp.]
MKFVYLLIKILILLVFLILAISNLQTVPFFYLPTEQINLPLIAVLFGAFLIGAIFGVFAMFGRLLRLRSENNRLRREVEKTARMSAQDLNTPTHQPSPATVPAKAEKAAVK